MGELGLAWGGAGVVGGFLTIAFLLFNSSIWPGIYPDMFVWLLETPWTFCFFKFYVILFCVLSCWC